MKKIIYSIPTVNVVQMVATTIMNPGSVSTIEKGGNVSQMTDPPIV